MTRIVNSGNATELAKSAIIGCVLADLDFASGHLYVNDGLTAVSFGGNTYVPLGSFAGLDAVEETLDTIARAVVMTLSGVDPSIIGTAQNETYQNRAVIIYFALIDQKLGTPVATPEIAWEGRMDTMKISIDQNVGKITLNCEHRLRREPKIARYTDVDQQNLHTGDTFFNFTATIAGFKSQWGDQMMAYGGPGSTYYYGVGPGGGTPVRSGR